MSKLNTAPCSLKINPDDFVIDEEKQLSLLAKNTFDSDDFTVVNNKVALKAVTPPEIDGSTITLVSDLIDALATAGIITKKVVG